MRQPLNFSRHMELPRLKSLGVPLETMASPVSRAALPGALLDRIRRHGFGLCVLAALGCLWWWGHHTRWLFAMSAPAVDLEAAEENSAVGLTAQIVRGQAGGPTSIQLSAPDLAELLGFECVPARRQALCRELAVPAHVSYDQGCVAKLTSRVAGSVWRVEKRVGQPIRRGEVLAVIDSLQVGKAKAELLQALADFELKRKLAARLGPAAANAVPYKQIEQVQADLRHAQFELFNAQQSLVNLGLAVDLEQLVGLSDAELVDRVKLLGLPESITRELNPQTATANLLPLVAPFDGCVIGQDIVNGEVVSTLEKGFEIADVSRMVLKLSVREEDSEQLRLGQSVAFRVGERELETTISWISTEVDRKTRSVDVRCDTANPPADEAVGQHLLRANMFLTARVRIEQKPAALVVPARAVQWTGGMPVVFVRAGPASFDVRPVELGIETDELTEIVSGLDADEAVVTAGSHMLKSEVARSRPGRDRGRT